MTPKLELEFPNWLDVAARSHPHKLALEYGSERWTFADLQQSAAATAATLKNIHGHRGGRIGILSANRPGFVFAVHAATRLGVPFVPLNWRQSSDEIAWQVRDAGISLLLVDEERASVAATACAGLRVTTVSIRKLELPPPREPPSPVKPGEGGRGVRADHEAAVIYTSGTSGRPKGACLTYGNLWFSAVASALHLGHRADDVWLAAMPLVHIGGLSILYRGVIGATPVILHNRFDPETSLHAIEEGATLVSVVPTMLRRMLDVRGETPWPASPRCVLLGGSFTPQELIDEAIRRGIPVAPTYGLTEASSQVTTLLPAQAPEKRSSSGLPLPLTEVRIATPSGQAHAGEIGEIEIRGPTLFAGYLGDKDGSSGRTPDDWFPTGDAGFLDEDGFLYVVDRRDDLIVSGGENVYPAEIERVLRDHPLVADAGVIGDSDETWGARPIAAVVWNGDPATAEGQLRRHCELRLSRYKIPDRIQLVAELPRTASGKLLRRALREMILGKRGGASTPDEL